MDLIVSNKHLTLRDWLVDVLVTLAAFLFAYVQLYLSTSPIIFTDSLLRDSVGILTRNPGQGTYLALAFTTLPLVFRRKLPWPTFLLVLIVFSSAQNDVPGYAFSVVGPVIAMFTITYERSTNEVITAGIIAFCVLLVANIPSDNDSVAAVVRIQNITFVMAALAGGAAARTYQNYVRAAEERAAEAERTRESEAARRVEEERLRIAREIHDITAHSLSAVSIQAAAAEKLLDVNAEAAREAIQQVRATSKTALDEIRSMIGVLRNEDSEAETRPTAGTDHLGDLLDYARGAGLDVELDQGAYDKGAVPAYADVALFGIAREAVTNTVRHAHASRLRIELSSDPRQAALTVEDDGCGRVGEEFDEQTADGTGSGGHGLAGMAERAHVLHGTFRADNRPEGGFAVHVTLPLDGADASQAAADAASPAAPAPAAPAPAPAAPADARSAAPIPPAGYVERTAS